MHGFHRGQNPREDLYDLLASQRLQAKHQGGNTYALVEVNSGWLSVGHIDETMCFVPKGKQSFGVILPDPKRAYNLLASVPAHRAVFYSPGSKELEGTVASSTGNTIEVNVDRAHHPGNWDGGWVRIWRGTGQGQVARVDSWAGKTITVNEVWDFPTAAKVWEAIYKKTFHQKITWHRNPVTGEGFVIVEGCERWEIDMGPGNPSVRFPALTTAGELVQDSLLWDANYKAANSIQNLVWRESRGPRKVLGAQLGRMTVKKIPVFYMCDYQPKKTVEQAAAMCPNMVNLQPVCLAAGSPFAYVGLPLGPRRSPPNDKTDVKDKEGKKIGK